MSERKVLNKYFPPDFDPALVPRERQGKAGPYTYKVRLMAPFSMRCNMCKEYIYKGKKFNARQETVRNENYLGIKIYRFYIRCPSCSAEITFKTDPKNADYICEHGAERNFESWREEEFATEERTYRQQLEEKLNPMKKLEDGMVASKREMEILEGLDEVRTENALRERVSADAALEAIHVRVDRDEREAAEKRKREDEEDEALARSIFRSTTQDGVLVKRLLVEDEEGDEHDGGEDGGKDGSESATGTGNGVRRRSSSNYASFDFGFAAPAENSKEKVKPVVIVKKPRASASLLGIVPRKQQPESNNNNNNNNTNALSLISGNYSSSEEEEETL